MKTKSPKTLKRLFLGYRSFVDALASGLTSEEVADTTLAFFAPTEEVVAEMLTRDGRKEILKALARAHREGRVRYGEPQVGFHGPRLIELFLENGLPPFNPPPWMGPVDAVRFLKEDGWLDAVRRSGIDLEIVG
jgi:hypothetical protein